MDIPAAVKRMKLLESGIAINELTIIRMAHRVFISGWAGEPGGTRRIRRKTRILQAETAAMRIEKMYLFWSLLQSGKIKMKWNVK